MFLPRSFFLPDQSSCFAMSCCLGIKHKCLTSFSLAQTHIEDSKHKTGINGTSRIWSRPREKEISNYSKYQCLCVEVTNLWQTKWTPTAGRCWSLIYRVHRSSFPLTWDHCYSCNALVLTKNAQEWCRHTGSPACFSVLLNKITAVENLRGNRWKEQIRDLR